LRSLDPTPTARAHLDGALEEAERAADPRVHRPCGRDYTPPPSDLYGNKILVNYPKNTYYHEKWEKRLMEHLV